MLEYNIFSSRIQYFQQVYLVLKGNPYQHKLSCLCCFNYLGRIAFCSRCLLNVFPTLAGVAELFTLDSDIVAKFPELAEFAIATLAMFFFPVSVFAPCSSFFFLS